MGAVFLAEHTLLGRRAAIKILLTELSSRRESVDRFFNEARATTSISDPGIVQVFDFGFTTDNVAYIVMELLEGEQLNRRLRRMGTLAPRDALQIARQVAGSLGAAHAAGIVHRDLKPENLYMVRDLGSPGGERPKILDFGIAKLADDHPDRLRTTTGAIMGTPIYMSPEQCNGAARVDHRADIYALGCVMFHLITGRPPFDLAGVGAIISAHMREPPPRPSSLVDDLPTGIDELILRCLAKSPDDRYGTMLELQQACDAVLAGLAPRPSAAMPIPSAVMPAMSGVDAVPTPQHISVDQRPTAPPRRRLGRWIVLVALAGGTGAVIAVLSARPTDAPPAGPPVVATPQLPAAVAPEPARVAIDDATVAPPPDAAVAPPVDAASPDPQPAIRKPAPRPAAKPRPVKPPPEDVYDDRN